ncbi:MAG: electron transporter SenC [Alteromonadaceae bacterium]|nr:MAG: electron transporter SenC [Alteromonadaceae bacterium]
MIRKISAVVIASALLTLSFVATTVQAKSPWGKNYFPNTELITHEGKKVRFFDDLIEGKIVAVNFIYTSCPDMCPLETAQLVKVQKIMGDRVGKDIHFYSISIDPKNDTPEVLKDYRKRYGAKWTFLTGDRQEIITLRRKLGLYIEGVEEGGNINNHNVSMIVGNQATGRWMKRSPFENPYILADQLGNWLSDWKPPQRGKDYSEAPSLRNMLAGEPLFRTRCASCHSVDGFEEDGALGPDLAGVTERRERLWLIKWLKAPDRMIEQKDPLALALLKKYNNLQMPNLRLTEEDVVNLLDYMATLKVPSNAPQAKQAAAPASPSLPSAGNDVVAVMNAWVREAHPNATVNAGYMTLLNAGDDAVTVKSVTSPSFDRVEIHEMSMVDGMMEMRELKTLKIAGGGMVKLAPGGKHLMLKAPKKRVVDGDQVTLVLEFESGAKQTLLVKVKKTN